MTRINFIPAGRQARGRARRRRAAWIRFLRVYSLLLAVAAGLTFLPARADNASQEASLARLDRRIESTTKELTDLRKQTAEVSKRLELARAVSDHPDWSALLRAIAVARADVAVIETMDLSVVREDKPDKTDKPGPAGAGPAGAGGGKPAGKPNLRDTVTLRLSGVASSPEACLAFAAGLEKHNLFERVTLKDTRAHQLGKMSGTHFDIEAWVSVAATPIAGSTP